jgi:hypothetical protein
MGGIFNFAGPEGHLRGVRNIDNDAPAPMRQQVLAVAYDLLPQCLGAPTEQQLYYGIEQMLGLQAAGNPMGGRRQRLGRDLGNAEWPRVYDVVSWLWNQFQPAAQQEVFRNGVNEVLAANCVVWDLGVDGNMHRVLPGPAQVQVEATIRELGLAQYAPALGLFSNAVTAYDERPQRGREACINAFQAVESVAQIRFNMAGRTLDDVIGDLRRRERINPSFLDVLERLNVLRHRNFGHGGAQAFDPTPVEVDFIYLNCIAAILLLFRTP